MRLQTSLLPFLLLLGACSDSAATEPQATPSKLVPAEDDGTWPERWVPVASYGGRAVETRREDYPSGKVRRLHCYVQASDDQELVHGPDMRWHENGVPERRTLFEDGVEHGLEGGWFENGQPRRIGEYRRGERDGEWLEYFEDGVLRARRHYADGAPHGSFEEWQPPGAPKSETHWDHGAQVGVERRWRGLHLVREASWENGLLVGPEKEFYDNGDPRSEGTNAGGKKNGRWTFWNPGGVRYREVPYADDEMHGVVTEWRPDGSKLSEIEYARDLVDGKQVAWHENGTKQMEGHMVGRERQGMWTYWRTDGSVNEAWTGEYIDDEKQD